MKKSPSLRMTVIISILFHIGLFAFLLVKFSSSPKVADNSNANVIKAVAIQEKSISSPSHSPTPLPQELTEPLVAAEKIQKLEQKVLATDHPQRELIAKTLPDQSVEEEVVTEPAPESLKKVLEKAKQIKAKKMAAQKQKETKKKLERTKKRHDLAAKELQQELSQEQQRVSSAKKQLEIEEADNTEENDDDDDVADINPSQLKEEGQQLEAAKAAGNQKELEKYKQLIIQAISKRWLMPESLAENLSYKVLVHLGPGGVVVSIETLKESGNSTLDQSAHTAIMKSSPLPVPENSELFDKFRSLRLTFRPQGIISG